MKKATKILLLLLVYTDNYLTDPLQPFSVRNRFLVAKVTYWLNL